VQVVVAPEVVTFTMLLVMAVLVVVVMVVTGTDPINRVL
jgi:hypothetical protein